MAVPFVRWSKQVILRHRLFISIKKSRERGTAIYELLEARHYGPTVVNATSGVSSSGNGTSATNSDQDDD